MLNFFVFKKEVGFKPIKSIYFFDLNPVILLFAKKGADWV